MGHVGKQVQILGFGGGKEKGRGHGPALKWRGGKPSRRRRFFNWLWPPERR
jgi:hypothetical protein